MVQVWTPSATCSPPQGVAYFPIARAAAPPALWAGVVAEAPGPKMMAGPAD